MSELKGAYRSKENELNYLTFSQAKGLNKCAKSFMEEFLLKQAGKPTPVPHMLQQAFDLGTATEACLVGGTQGLSDCFKGEEGKLWKKPTKASIIDYEYYQKAMRWKAGDETIKANDKIKRVANGPIITEPKTIKSALWNDTIKYTEALKAVPDVKWMVENCQHSQILTSEFGGVRYKSELDFSSKKHNTIVDLKTSKDPFKKVWIERRGVRGKYASFIEGLDYDMQAYVYRQSWLQSFGIKAKYFIVVVGKSEETPVEIIDMNDDSKDDYFRELLDTQSAKWQTAKLDGNTNIQSCGSCKNCRGSKIPSFKTAVKSSTLFN